MKELKNKSVEDLWNDFDRSENDKIDMTKRSICIRLESMVDNSKKNDVLRELLLQNFVFVVKQILHCENIDVEQYKSRLKWFLDNCDDNSLDYYKRRLNETASFMNKWSYSFACWLLTNDKNYLDNAIESLISCAFILLEQETYNEIYVKIMDILNIIKFYNLNRSNLDLNNLLLKIIYKTNGTENARWMIEPVIVFAELNHSADYNLINNLITILHKNAYQFRIKNKTHLEKRLLEESIRLCKFMNLDSSQKNNLRKEIHCLIGESLERVAGSRLEDGVAAVSFFKDAQEEYKLAQRHDRVKALNERIREASSKIQWNVSTVRTKMLPLKLTGNNGFQFVNSICNYTENIPQLDWISNLTRELMEKYPISSLVTNISFNDKNPTSYDKTDDEIFESRVKQQIIQFIKLGESRLALAVKELEASKKLSAKDFLGVLRSIGLHEDDQMKIIASGIEDHFNKRYTASISTLVPMIEGTLRSLLESKGISILRNKDEFILDSELGRMLADERVKKLLGNNYTNYLKTKYSDPDGINERNRVSHALSKAIEFNHENSLAIIKTIFNIADLSLKK